MKLPFPYWLAAEFYLFQSSRKLTLIHIIVLGIPSALSGIAFASLVGRIHWLLGGIASAVVFLATIVVCFRVGCSFLPLLMKSVERGWVAHPDMARWEKQVYETAGWKH